jgi:hypothetical protein
MFYYLLLSFPTLSPLKTKNGTKQISVAAYKHADGKKIDGKRVLVDVERARTVKGWLPRRLGGGLGGTRRGGVEVNIKHSGREDNAREKERYLLEKERENRRVDDRRGDSEFEGECRGVQEVSWLTSFHRV